MSEYCQIEIGVCLVASIPFILALTLRRFWPRAPHRIICHAISAALLLALSGGYYYALREYRLAGHDDGSSSMAAYVLVVACLIVIPENLIIYIFPLTKK
jgi:hypothetical protein